MRRRAPPRASTGLTVDGGFRRLTTGGRSKPSRGQRRCCARSGRSTNTIVRLWRGLGVDGNWPGWSSALRRPQAPSGGVRADQWPSRVSVQPQLIASTKAPLRRGFFFCIGCRCELGTKSRRLRMPYATIAPHLTVAPSLSGSRLVLSSGGVPRKSMNDNAIALSGTNRTTLGGLAHRLVQDGLLDEAAMLDAVTKAKEKRANLVTHLVASNLATARDIAISASNEFGVPLLDLDAVAIDMDAVRAVSDKLLQKHRVLPLMKRGKRLFLAVADPTNLHALDEIRFQTSMSIEFVVVEDDKLQTAVNRAIDQADAAMPSFTDDDLDLENLEVTGGDEEAGGDALGRDDVEDAPIVRFVNKILLDAIKKGASDIHFEPYERSFRIRTRIDGVLKEVALPPGAARRQNRRAPEGHVAARHRRAARAAGRPHQDAAFQEPRHRLSRQHLPHAVRRESGHTYSRSLERHARHRCPGLRAGAARDSILRYLAKPQGMILVTGPTGSGKTVSLYTGLNILNTEDTQYLDGRGSGGNQSARHQPGQREQQGGAHLRRGPARVPAPGPRCHHGRRNPRPRDRGDRHQGRTDRPLGAVDPAHQRCAADPDPPG